MSTPLVIRDAVVELGGRRVLNGIDLDVDTGEFVALLGTNGSGKSTLVRTAIGLVPLVSGSVELFGTPLKHFSQWHRLGYVPQQSAATSGVPSTVQEVVMSGRLSRRRPFSRRRDADFEAVSEAVERVGLTERLRDSVDDLSGGQQQRVLIARALAGRSDLLVLDEPTAGIDHDNQESLAELLGGLVNSGTSVLLVAHELGLLEPLVDRAVVLHGGEVEYCGPVAGLGDAEHAHIHAHTGQPPKARTLSPEGIWR